MGRVRIKEKSSVVPGEEGKKITLEPYEKWPLPYRGSKYSLIERRIEGKKRMVVAWKYKDFEPLYHRNDSGNPTLPKNLLRAYRKVGKRKGSFRVTPHKEVITKTKNTNGNWEAFYLGKLEGEWNFRGVDLNPDLEKLDVWDGLSFNHGEYWSVWVREGAGAKLRWSISKGVRGSSPKRRIKLYFESINTFQELTDIVRNIRPKGGGIYFNEFSHIWMNLPGTQVSSQYEHKIKSKIENWEKDEARNKNIVQKRLRETNCWPIYLGQLDEYIHGQAPRTYFEDLEPYWEKYSEKNGL